MTAMVVWDTLIAVLRAQWPDEVERLSGLTRETRTVDLPGDSLDMIEITMALEERCGLKFGALDEGVIPGTLGEVEAAVIAAVAAGEVTTAHLM